MAQNTTINVPAATWTQLTNATVTSITFQNISPIGSMMIKGTVGAVTPTDFTGAIRYGHNQGERNAALTDLFPGISGVTQVYAYSANGGQVVVSHA